MDTLALLCNLHADGPATLQRLRRAGCDSLGALRRLDPLTLAERLEWHERTAERFLREAALLSGRVEEEDLAEGPEEPEFELESALGEEPEGLGDEAESEVEEDDVESVEEEQEVAQLEAPAEKVEAVLGTWRQLDQVAPPGPPEEFEIPRPTRGPDLSLRSVELEGLSQEVLSRLADLGVFTLRDLVEAPALDLSRSIPLGYTRVKRLCFLATREIEALPVSPPEAEAAGFETFTPPPHEPFETAGPPQEPPPQGPFETAGPFA